MARITREKLDTVIEMSAKGIPPKEIYTALDLDKALVYAIRSQRSDAIEARRRQLTAAGEPKLSPTQAFDQIMGVIAPVKPGPDAPEPRPEPAPKAVPNPEPPRLNTVQVRLTGERHRYTVTGKRIGIDGDLTLDADELTGFIRELESIQALIVAQERTASA